MGFGGAEVTALTLAWSVILINFKQISRPTAKCVVTTHLETCEDHARHVLPVSDTLVRPLYSVPATVSLHSNRAMFTSVSAAFCMSDTAPLSNTHMANVYICPSSFRRCSYHIRYILPPPAIWTLLYKVYFNKHERSYNRVCTKLHVFSTVPIMKGAISIWHSA